MNLERLRGRLLASLLIGAIVFVALSAYADFGDVIAGLGEFEWRYLPLILLLSLANYVLRFLKWQYYLGKIGVSGISWRDSALTYFSGLGMVVTPGKVGEWLKCFLLREVNGTPFSRSAPIPIAERLTDSLGLVILGAAGLALFGDAWPAFALVVAGGALLVILARNRPLSLWLLRRLDGLPLVSRFTRQAEDFLTSSYTLLSPGALVSMTLLSVVSWGFEVLGFYLVLIGLGLDGSWDVLLKASFIMPAATLASALLLTPGGLGVAEAGITGMSQVLLDLTKSQAAIGALVIRLGTLWFGVLIGVLALFAFLRFARPDAAMANEAAVEEPPGAS